MMVWIRMKSIFHFILLCFIIHSQTFSQNKSRYQQEIREMEAFIRKQMELDRIPGLSIGFYKNDFQWARGFAF